MTIDDYFNAYDILIAPMLYMFHNNVLEKLKNFVSQNKILVTTYFTGKVDENDQVFIGKKQKELEELLGLRILELDNSYDDEFNEVIYHNHVYQTKQYQEIIELYQAKALAYYQKDFYKNTPAITYHKYHQGHVYYMAARFHKDCLHDFYESIACKYKQKLIKSDEEVSIQVRLNERYEYYFIMNFSNQSKTVIVNQEGYDMLEQKNVNQNIILSPYHVKIIRLEKTKNC